MAVRVPKTINQASNNNHSAGSGKKISLNIGTIIFGAIFIYIMASFFIYLLATHVISYQVTSGPLAKNQTYTALIVREEEVVDADVGGYVTYYAKENNKVRKTGIVYGVGNEKNTSDTTDISDSDLNTIKTSLENFSGSYQSSNFLETYNLEYEVKSEIISSQMPDLGTSSIGVTMTVNDQTLATASCDGIVVYAADGFENYDTSSISSSDFDEKKYVKTNLKTDEKIKSGDPVYKLVTSETWSVIIPLTSRQIVDLAGKTSIRVHFLKDNKTQSGSMKILTGEDGSYYGQISFSSGLIRYINDRFLSIELVTNTQTGLKIPVTSVVSKNFYIIPDAYASAGGDSNNIGFIKRTVNDDGSFTDEFIETTLYEHKDGFYYVDSDDLAEGDILLKEGNSSDQYIIGATASLEGVYNLNKGYAMFRKIVILDKNEDYCIVEKGTAYGISQFDYIVLDAATVKEDEITAKG